MMANTTGSQRQAEPDQCGPQHFPQLPKASAGRSRWLLGMGALLAAALFSGCGSLPASMPGTPDAPVPDTLAVQYQVRPAKARNSIPRMTAQDIMIEWGTQGNMPPPTERGRLAKKIRLADRIDELPASEPALIGEIIQNAVCRSCESKPYHAIVLRAAERYKVPASLIHAVIQKESGYNPVATSRKQARGLMQITPGTGKFLGVADSRSLYDPQINIFAGVAYLKYLMREYVTIERVLAAYNAGPGNVRKYNGVPPFAETRRYVHDVKTAYAFSSRLEH